MRKTVAVTLLLVLGVSSFGGLISMVSAQGSTESINPTVWVRWSRFRGSVTEWGSESCHGSLLMNAKTVNVPTVRYRPWASVSAVWSNEQQPFASVIKPVGNFTYTHYTAKLVWLIALRPNQEGFNLNLTGIWNVNEIKITYKFDAYGVLTKTVRRVTPIATGAKGQLLILDGWKRFSLKIDGVGTLKGGASTIKTASSDINPFSFEADPETNFQDLMEIVKCFRAMPGFGNYVPELDYNLDSKIDVADLTTVAANM